MVPTLVVANAFLPLNPNAYVVDASNPLNVYDVVMLVSSIEPESLGKIAVKSLPSCTGINCLVTDVSVVTFTVMESASLLVIEGCAGVFGVLERTFDNTPLVLI